MALSVCGPVFTDQRGRELVEHGTPLFPVACYHDNIRDAEVPWHWHDELEVLVIEAGAAHVSVNGTDHLVKQGEGLFINAGALLSMSDRCAFRKQQSCWSPLTGKSPTSAQRAVSRK